METMSKIKQILAQDIDADADRVLIKSKNIVIESPESTETWESMLAENELDLLKLLRIDRAKMDEVRKVLHIYKYYSEELKEKQLKLNELEILNEHAGDTSSSLSITGLGSKNKIYDSTFNKVSVKQKISEAYKLYIDMIKLEIERIIEIKPLVDEILNEMDQSHRRIFELKHIHQNTLKTIQYKTGYSTKQCGRIEKKALIDFFDLYFKHKG